MRLVFTGGGVVIESGQAGRPDALLCFDVLRGIWLQVFTRASTEGGGAVSGCDVSRGLCVECRSEYVVIRSACGGVFWLRILSVVASVCVGV